MICLHYWQLALLLVIDAALCAGLGVFLAGRALDHKNGSKQ